MYNEDKRLKELRQYQYLQIEMIRFFVEICEKEQLTYYMLGGTMLGAIRHKGFIPWDDDADFGMPRPDYERFLLVAPSYMPQKIELQTLDNTENYHFYFSRMVCREKEVRVKWAKKEQNVKIWIDIFPLDGMPDKLINRKLHIFHLLFRRMMFVLSNFDESAFVNKKNRPLYEKILMAFALRVPIEKWISEKKQWHMLDKALKICPYEKSKYLINMMGEYKMKEMFQKSIFGKGHYYEFEGMLLNGPQDYDNYLSQLYGDYMTPPPLSDRNKHETSIINSNFPY